MKKYIILLLFIGCKPIKVDPPNNQILTENVFKNEGTANAAMGGIYGKLNDGLYTASYYLALSSGLCSDELTSKLIPELNEMYLNMINPWTNKYINGYWKGMYNLIYAVNNIIEKCSGSDELNEQVKQRLIAEASFVRAYVYFYLVNLYGPVPLVLTTDQNTNKDMSRSAVDKVYDQILKDLLVARAELSERYVGVDGVSPVEERFRPNSFTATALLSRVYLYLGRYSEAEVFAGSIINNEAYALASVDSVFLKGCKETIWLLNSDNSDNDITTLEGNKFILTSSPLLTGKQTITQSLLAVFEDSDLRKKKWINTFSGFYFPFKYKISRGVDDRKEASVVFRLAEQYLIRAEARAQSGKLLDGMKDLNAIRNRAGLQPLAGLSKEQLLAAIALERQRELFTEQGHRWLDLKRTGQVGAVCLLKSAEWKSFRELWPIPQQDIQNDHNLVQNDGY